MNIEEIKPIDGQEAPINNTLVSDYLVKHLESQGVSVTFDADSGEVALKPPFDGDVAEIKFKVKAAFMDPFDYAEQTFNGAPLKKEDIPDLLEKFDGLRASIYLTTLTEQAIIKAGQIKDHLNGAGISCECSSDGILTIPVHEKEPFILVIE
jgi:hypothetical protein